MIPAAQNSSAGALLGDFYTKNRVLHGEGFLVGFND